MRFMNLKALRAVLGALGLFGSFQCYGQVTINEVMADNRTIANFDGTISDWVELYNPGTQAVNLEGWSLTDSPAVPRKWVFPKNLSLPAGGFLVIALDSGRSPSTSVGGLLNAGFAIKGSGDSISLYSVQGALVQEVRFGPQVVDFSIGANTRGGANFVLCEPTPGVENIAQPLGSPLSLRINEWMASPSSGKDWFEIYNGGELPVALSGLYFTDDKLESSPVAPLSFVGRGRDAYLRFYADNSTNDNEVNFKLGAGGDAIRLLTLAGTLIDSVQFGQQLTDRSEGRLPDGAANIQPLNLATPNHSNLVLYDGLWINEILTHTDPPYEDAVEIYNDTAAAIDLSGWYLSNSRSELKKYQLPSGSVVPAKGYRVIYENQFNGASASIPFTFNSAHGDRVVLARAISGQLTGSIVEEEFEAAERGISFGRSATSVPGEVLFVPLDHPTFGVTNPASIEEFRLGSGAPNSGPKINPVVISEIMYNPSANAAANSGPDPDEYLKLTNTSGSPVALYDPENPENVWKLTRGVTYDFPRFTSIPAGGSILLVSFDPQLETTLAAAFRAKYGVPAGIPLFGPYQGKLDNGGETVALYRPDEPQLPPHPDAGFVPYVLVDRVDYADAAPWPSEADGTGLSLQKKSVAAFGNDPNQWIAAAPAAGTSPVVTAPSIGSVVRQGNATVITLEAVPGRQYSLQYRSDLKAGTVWRTAATMTASGPTLSLSDTSTADTRFYRVGVD